ncbi:alpha/beta fold hydrolase [Umezawaea beigongshangensis]|uniref:alpha/beta fold hydrolase n=1 Tax=Umezawaea beigongshangensis TaxID=2780383 RepID=UPI0018F20281|nr:alpha/beta fold hydrolase [Umezawaea beigongshangensis]
MTTPSTRSAVPPGEVAGLPGFRHEYAHVNGVRIHYVLGGEGPAVVLLHGWPFTWLEWRATLPLLAEAGFTVIAPDLRGSGHSDKPAGHWTKREEAEDLHQLVRSLGLTELNLVGTDVGTMTAHAWAQARSGEIRRLVLSEAFLPGFGLEERMNVATGGHWHFGFHAQTELAAELTAGREEQYLERFWSLMTAGGITAADRAELLRVHRAPDAMRGGFEHYATLVEDGRAARAGARLSMPVLVLNGEHGLPQQPLLDGAREAARDVRADVVPGSAHTIGADNPRWLAARLARFFGPDAD